MRNGGRYLALREVDDIGEVEMNANVDFAPVY
jgi:hypothetical protein